MGSTGGKEAGGDGEATVPTGVPVTFKALFSSACTSSSFFSRSSCTLSTISFKFLAVTA